ncbi:hypothetical protein BT96DRAFT_75779 [Gymnopus androsaceus JB14]|uniref:Uncharacterized protein n=1 Tax=Gymnopus androsaceus JB14 TaxID=1447944 RepID=A0A6A4HFZ8_9AGAR|nr:hypothetical protein BT96DRAFT_75779 [Gymnopus androsaceus JB14]
MFSKTRTVVYDQIQELRELVESCPRGLESLKLFLSTVKKDTIYWRDIPQIIRCSTQNPSQNRRLPRFRLKHLEVWKAHKYGEGRLSDAAIQIALAESPSSSSAIQPSLSTIEFAAPALETIILCACFKEPLLGEMRILQHAKYRVHRRTISTSDKQVEALVPPRQTVVTLMANELGSGNTMVSWLRRRYSVELMDRGVGASKWSTAEGIRVVAALGGREWCVNLGRNGLLMRALGRHRLGSGVGY